MTQSAVTANTLLQRKATVTIGDILIEHEANTGLDFDFTVRRGVTVTKKVVKPKPNTADLKLWNLSQASRDKLSQSRQTTAAPMSNNPQAGPPTIPCIISAGYVGRQSVIFSGSLRSGQSVTSGPDIVSELSSGDGDQALSQARLSLSLGPGSTTAIGLRALLSALGVGQGNLSKALEVVNNNPLVGQLFSKGAVLKGSAAELMTDICRTCGLQWSVQNGTAQFQALGQPLDSQAVLIDADHGMVGAPTVDSKGILSFVCLMIPDINPGVKVSMNAREVKGGYQILSVETTGSTYGNDWYHRVEAAPY